MKQEEKIRDLEERLALIKVDNSRLLEELRQSKKAASGYKGKNVQFQKELKDLKEQLENMKTRMEHYKQLDLEGDGLYEQKIAKLDDAKAEIERLQSVRDDVVPKKNYDELKKSVDKKVAFIEQLQERVQELMIERSNLQCTVKAKDNIIEELEETIDELSKPWWKKIF